ncbi:hypothetical protein MMC21_006221 [Puttea exsequens]|nr:hypothetical protein [Puttea exsequens]
MQAFLIFASLLGLIAAPSIPNSTRFQQATKKPAWPTFNVLEDTVATVKAHSGTQTGDSFLLGKLGTTPMITSKYAGSKTKSFPRKSTYIACIVASQTVLVLQACKLQFTGTKAAGGATVTTMCQYSGTLAKPAMVLYAGRGLSPATTVIELDDITGVTFAL